jgi:hypothetical protein
MYWKREQHIHLSRELKQVTQINQKKIMKNSLLRLEELNTIAQNEGPLNQEISLLEQDLEKQR